MLFDLRGRGRRRVVQVIYLSLAILMGGGLVLFGIGGAGGGGLLDAFNDDSTSTSDIVQQRLDQAETRVRNNPTSAAALAALTRARFQSAEFDQNTGAFTDEGKQQLQNASAAWDRYLGAVEKPDPNLATLMVQAYSELGLNQPEKAVSAMETVIAGRPDPTAALYLQLSALAYQAGQTRKGQLAGDKAIELAPKDDREQVKAQVEAFKSQAAGASTTTTPSS